MVVLPFAADACILASMRGEGGDAVAAPRRRSDGWRRRGFATGRGGLRASAEATEGGLGSENRLDG